MPDSRGERFLKILFEVARGIAFVGLNPTRAAASQAFPCGTAHHKRPRRAAIRRGLFMSKWIHRLTHIDAQTKTALCSCCGPVHVRVKKSSSGKPRFSCRIRESQSDKTYSLIPSVRAKRIERNRNRPYQSPDQRAPDPRLAHLVHRKPACERCGFNPENKLNLDVHHRDRNRKNNSPENLETLCVGCHRLEHRKRRPRPEASRSVCAKNPQPVLL